MNLCEKLFLYPYIFYPFFKKNTKVLTEKTEVFKYVG